MLRRPGRASKAGGLYGQSEVPRRGRARVLLIPAALDVLECFCRSAFRKDGFSAVFDPGRGAKDLSPDPKGFLRPELLAGEPGKDFPPAAMVNSPPE